MEKESSYIVSARKYRPATFRTVVGQSALTQTLKNAIDSGRLAHAYLFCGPRGVGKTSCARIFAKTINCLSPTPEGEACGVCESCRSIDQGVSYNLIELDAASNNGVDQMRDFIEQVNVPPQVGRYRVFIIDEVHMLTSQAFNAFLKTLEEPPSYVIFIMATTEKHKVLPTILSRCQIYDFKRITVADTVNHLKYVASSEGIEVEEPALNIIARKADGAMRDALSIFDQVTASSNGKVTYQSTVDNLNVLDYDYFFRLTETFRSGDVPGALLIYKEVRDKGFDSLFFVNGLAAHVRDLMVAVDPRTVGLLEVGEEIGAQYTALARSLPVEWYYKAMRLLNDCDVAYRTAGNKQLLVELTLIRLCQLLTVPEAPSAPAPVKPVKTPAQTPSQSPAQTPAQAPASPSPSPAASAPVSSAPVSSAPASASAQQTAVQTATSQAAPRPAASSAPRVSAPQPGAAPRPTVSGARVMAPRAVHVAPVAAAPKAPGDRAFSPEEFLAAWNEFAAANGDRHILVSGMRASQPEPVSPVLYKVKVTHPAQLTAFETDMQRLEAFLRERLGNDSVQVRAELSEAAPVERRLSQNELLETIVSENAVIANLLSGMEAELV